MDTRTCPRCQRTLTTAQFAWRDAAHTRRQSWCRGCTNGAWKRWYADPANRAEHIRKANARRRERIDRNREIVAERKRAPCADCGGTFAPEAMDFDHIGAKTADISTMVVQNGTERLLDELERCELVCANCHRLRTFRDQR